MAKSVTMRDIAEKVGVSTVTVSKALTDKDGVGSELRAVIKQTAEQMGYHYSIGTRAFREGKSYNVGVLVEEHYVENAATAFPFYMKMYHSVIMQLTKFHYSAIMEVVTPAMMKEFQMPNVVTGQKVDGIIVLGQIKLGYLNMVRESQIPMVYLDFYDRNMEVPSVITDNVYGSYMLANYLVSKGHTKMAFVGSIDATPSILDRYLGYYRSLLVNHLPFREEYVIPDRGEDGLFIELELPENDMPTAFVCNCDEIAYILMERLSKMGYRIPEDISVVGFDNYAFATYTAPKLTTIEVNVEEMTKYAVEILIRLMKGEEDVHGRKVISGKLIVRDSVAEAKR
ncbi:MAG: LacI family DNA-binding transcriptional regulator [Roseburia sp.]